MWSTYKNARVDWENEMIELRTFLYATSTKDTQVGMLPFKNSTTIPKLAQIAVNLMANYSAHLFASPEWASFEGFDNDSLSKENRRVIEAYVRTKIKRKDYEHELKKCLTDWVNTGVCFASQRYVTEYGVDPMGNEKVLYQGTVLERIPPQDIVFDVTADSFDKAIKIVRRVYTLGDIARDIEENSGSYFTKEDLENMRDVRIAVRQSGMKKAPEGIDWEGLSLTRDGFGDLLEYMSGDLVEVLEFYGDIYSVIDGEFKKNHKIIIADRRLVIYDEQLTTENGSQRLYYSGWEQRPDNLMAISPLARIVGMQFKIDKLENLRADIFDKFANPITVESGNVEFYGVYGAPGGRYVIDDAQGRVSYLTPPQDALQADFQINNTMNIMEMMAGSPQNASGFRTPGEKTKFEVQILDQGANRIFRDKTKQFEKEFIEPILNDIVAFGRENLGEVDLVGTTSSEFNIETFISVKREDLFVSGQMRARGSALFAEKANALQNLMTITSTGLGQQIAPHISTKRLAKAVEDLADIGKFNIIIPNIAIQESMEQQQLAAEAQKQIQTAEAVAAEDEVLRDVQADEDAENLQA
jgi:hypothetical protein